MEEQEVTRLLKEHLEKEGWKILSVNYPRGQGGLSISNGKKERIVPDLVAKKNDIVLITECKPKFSYQDVEKLNKLFGTPRLLKNLRKKLKLSPSVKLQKAIGVNSINFTKDDVPSDFVTFLVKETVILKLK
mgnify:CR=1 FL=1